jgi:ADP-ribose pyrophosphatase YjhB (NUDIX family)
MNFCSNCGNTITTAIPADDNRERFCCNHCGMIHYQNPRLVVGCIPEWQNTILLCLRDIEPRRNRWTLPAGYLENGESVQQGAQRETYEEARAEVSDLEPYFMADLVRINQIYLMFRCKLNRPEFRITPESKEVRLFREEDIPWDNIAFPVIEETLKAYFSDRKKGTFPLRNVIVNTTLHNRHQVQDPI